MDECECCHAAMIGDLPSPCGKGGYHIMQTAEAQGCLAEPSMIDHKIYEPLHEKTCLWGFQPGKTPAGLLGYRDELES